MSIRIVTDSTSDLSQQLIDRYQITVKPNILVIEGNPYQDGKDISREAIYQRLSDRYVRVFALFDTRKFLQRSGRKSQARFHIASFLQIRPLIELKNGQVINRGEYRTRKRSIQQLCDRLESFSKLKNLVILHTNAEMDAIDLMNKYAYEVSGHVGVCNVTTVIGTHVGPNALGFAAVVHT